MTGSPSWTGSQPMGGEEGGEMRNCLMGAGGNKWPALSFGISMGCNANKQQVILKY